MSEACESVWSVSWLLRLLIVTLLECYEKCRTSSQMPNMLIWYMSMASAMVVPLLLLKNTVCAEFRFVGCFSLFITLLAFFSVLMFRLNEQVNNMWRKRKAFLKWYSVALPVARENFLHASVFHEQHVCVANITWRWLVPISPTACAKSTPSGEWYASRIFSTDYIVIANCFH